VLHRGSSPEPLPQFDLQSQDIEPDDANRSKATQLPMTNIGPKVAERFAGLVNCRLPTSADGWRHGRRNRSHLPDIRSGNFADQTFDKFATALGR